MGQNLKFVGSGGKMAYKKSKKVSFDKNCVMEALHLRGSSIRKLDDAYEFGWSSKSVERGLKAGEVTLELLDALGRYLNVEPDYLSGKYHRQYEKIKDPFIREICMKSLRAGNYPYIKKQHKTKMEGKFLYDRYIENVLVIHNISMEQFNSMEEKKRKDFQIELENVIAPILIKYFLQNALGKDIWPEVYRLQSEIEDYGIAAEELLEDF